MRGMKRRKRVRRWCGRRFVHAAARSVLFCMWTVVCAVVHTIAHPFAVYEPQAFFGQVPSLRLCSFHIVCMNDHGGHAESLRDVLMKEGVAVGKQEPIKRTHPQSRQLSNACMHKVKGRGGERGERGKETRQPQVGENETVDRKMEMREQKRGHT